VVPGPIVRECNLCRAMPTDGTFYSRLSRGKLRLCQFLLSDAYRRMFGSVLECQSPTAVPVIYKDELKAIRRVARLHWSMSSRPCIT
jgi:hypothetical protein